MYDFSFIQIDLHKNMHCMKSLTGTVVYTSDQYDNQEQSYYRTCKMQNPAQQNSRNEKSVSISGSLLVVKEVEIPKAM